MDAPKAQGISRMPELTQPLILATAKLGLV